MPPKKSDLNNVRTRSAQRQRVKRSQKSAEEIAARREYERIKTAERRLQKRILKLTMDTPAIQSKTDPDPVIIKKEEIVTDMDRFSEEYNRETELDFKMTTIMPDNTSFHQGIMQVKSETNIVEEDMNIKTEYYSSDEMSDHFIEICLKDEKPTKEELCRINQSCFDPDTIIKEELDIKVEEHEIKLEPNGDFIEDKCKQEKRTKSKKLAEKLKCLHCSYETPTRSSLNKHKFLHEHPNKVPYYFCTNCSYKTRQKSHLKRHDLVHQNPSNLEMFKCYICGIETKEKGTLKRHILSVHRGDLRKAKMKSPNRPYNDRCFSCSECSYKTHTKSLLNDHMDKHKDTSDVDNLYICDVCSFVTKYRKNLRAHLDTHKDIEQLTIYECSLCNFRSRKGNSLKRHLASKKHLRKAGKLEEYVPRGQSLKADK